MEERAPKKEFRCAFTGKETRFSMVFVIGNPPLRVSNFWFQSWGRFSYFAFIIADAQVLLTIFFGEFKNSVKGSVSNRLTNRFRNAIVLTNLKQKGFDEEE
jgi:hypothetical protein